MLVRPAHNVVPVVHEQVHERASQQQKSDEGTKKMGAVLQPKIHAGIARKLITTSPAKPPASDREMTCGFPRPASAEHMQVWV